MLFCVAFGGASACTALFFDIEEKLGVEGIGHTIEVNVWVSIFALFLAGCPEALLAWLCTRKTYREVLDVKRKTEILVRWRFKSHAFKGLACLYLAACYIYLWQFAMNAGSVASNNFALSVVINVSYKFLLRPLFLSLVISSLICGMRLTERCDWLLYALPTLWFDFTMHTSANGDDLAAQTAALLGYDDVLSFGSDLLGGGVES